MPKFKKDDLVREDCGCIIRILKVGRKFYTAIHLDTPIHTAQVNTNKKGEITSVKTLPNINDEFIVDFKTLEEMGKKVKIAKVIIDEMLKLENEYMVKGIKDLNNLNSVTPMIDYIYRKINNY